MVWFDEKYSLCSRLSTTPDLLQADAPYSVANLMAAPCPGGGFFIVFGFLLKNPIPCANNANTLGILPTSEIVDCSSLQSLPAFQDNMLQIRHERGSEERRRFFCEKKTKYT